MGPGEAEFVEEHPAEGRLQLKGEGSPVGLEVEGGIEAVEIGVATAFGVEGSFHRSLGRGNGGRAAVRAGDAGGRWWCGSPEL
jgi:hypothetical protein